MVDDPNKTESGSFIDDDYLSADEPATSATPQKVNIKEIFAQNPMLKVAAIGGGIVFLLLAYMVFGGSSGKPNPEEEISAVRSTPDVSQTPGTAELPPAYEEAVRQANQQAVDTALATEGSVIPTPIARPSERIEAPVQVEENDPLSEWRREAENRRIERQQQDEAMKAAQEAALTPPPLPVDAAQTAEQAAQAAAAQNPPLPTVPSTEQVQAISQQLLQQMQVAIEAQTPADSAFIALPIQPSYDMKKYFPDPVPAAGAPGTATAAGTQVASANGTASIQPAQPKPIIPAGTIAYAQIITEANSDIPGPVLAEVASGPLLGGRALGTFQVAERRLVLQFSRIVKDGIEYPVQAFALDPATTLPGIVSDVNNHYFRRILLPAAAAFIQGFADAATQTQTEVVVSNGTVVSSNQNELDTGQELLRGAREAGSKLSEVVDEDADRPRTIRVFTGTRIGLLFMSSVFDPNAQQNMYANNQQPGQQGQQGLGQAVFNASPYGQAYNAYQNYQQGQQQNAGYGSQQQGQQPTGLYSNQTNTGRIQPF